MWKLCPIYRCAGVLAASSAWWTWSTNSGFDRGVWLSQWKRGPGTSPQWDRYDNNAVTGQRSLFVLRMTSFTPLLNWSVFWYFNMMEMVLGSWMLSTAMSEKQTWFCGSNFDSHYTVIFQNLQRLKKVFIDATHSTVLIKVGLPSNHTLRSLQRIEGVVGRRGWGCMCLPILAAWTVMPLRT